MKINSKNRIIWWIPAIGLCSLIFYATSSPSFTGHHTSSVIGQLIEGLFSLIGLNVDPSVIIDPLNLLFRKSGHFIFFGLLAILFRIALTHTLHPYRYAWIATTLYAMVDEFHQSFVPGRSASVLDVALDSIGAAVALLLMKKYLQKKTSR
ncbi:VanZ family protein [Bacillus sp. PS06]|uniref:VanZ family protein n=1 Tax=Bacillus sp. PS06 TaxID=2764176 RepID=UPI0017862199|nr:VanZ family protein [Bacillus sp. PS06]MBD8070602.1 VanZ family protein [Bacillus sp. PS06]